MTGKVMSKEDHIRKAGVKRNSYFLRSVNNTYWHSNVQCSSWLNSTSERQNSLIKNLKVRPKNIKNILVRMYDEDKYRNDVNILMDSLTGMKFTLNPPGFHSPPERKKNVSYIPPYTDLPIYNTRYRKKLQSLTTTAKKSTSEISIVKDRCKSSNSAAAFGKSFLIPRYITRQYIRKLKSSQNQNFTIRDSEINMIFADMHDKPSKPVRNFTTKMKSKSKTKSKPNTLLITATPKQKLCTNSSKLITSGFLTFKNETAEPFDDDGPATNKYTSPRSLPSSARPDSCKSSRSLPVAKLDDIHRPDNELGIIITQKPDKFLSVSTEVAHNTTLSTTKERNANEEHIDNELTDSYCNCYSESLHQRPIHINKYFLNTEPNESELELFEMRDTLPNIDSFDTAVFSDADFMDSHNSSKSTCQENKNSEISTDFTRCKTLVITDSYFSDSGTLEEAIQPLSDSTSCVLPLITKLSKWKTEETSKLSNRYSQEISETHELLNFTEDPTVLTIDRIEKTVANSERSKNKVNLLGSSKADTLPVSEEYMNKILDTTKHCNQTTNVQSTDMKRIKMSTKAYLLNGLTENVVPQSEMSTESTCDRAPSCGTAVVEEMEACEEDESALCLTRAPTLLLLPSSKSNELTCRKENLLRHDSLLSNCSTNSYHLLSLLSG